MPHDPNVADPSVPKRQSRRQFVYWTIIERICSAEYTAGQRLPTEDELAREFELSRVTIRNALEMLRSSRLIVSVQGSGNYVGGLPLSNDGELLAGMEHASYDDILSFRVALESQAATLAAEHRSDTHLALMRDALDVHRAQGAASANSLVQYRLADLLFHEAMCEASSNPILIRLLKPTFPLFSMKWLLWRPHLEDAFPAMAEDVLAEHVMIMNAIAAQDGEMARIAMQFHLQHSHKRTAQRLSLVSSAGPDC